MSVDSEKPAGMTALEQFSAWAKDVHARMAEAGCFEATPYLGNRCGWYPAKPKRRRKRP